MNPIFRTLECLERILQKYTPRNTASILRKVDLKMVIFNQNVFHKVGQCWPCAQKCLEETQLA